MPECISLSGDKHPCEETLSHLNFNMEKVGGTHIPINSSGERDGSFRFSRIWKCLWGWSSQLGSHFTCHRIWCSCTFSLSFSCLRACQDVLFSVVFVTCQHEYKCVVFISEDFFRFFRGAGGTQGGWVFQLSPHYFMAKNRDPSPIMLHQPHFESKFVYTYYPLH